MLTPEQVEARNELERVARMTRKAAKMPPLEKEEERIEDIKESVLHSEHKPNRATPPPPLSFLQTNAAAPSWWPHAQKHGASSSNTRPTNQPSYNEIIQNVFGSSSFQAGLSSLPTLAPSSGGGGGGSGRGGGAAGAAGGGGGGAAAAAAAAATIIITADGVFHKRRCQRNDALMAKFPWSTK